jgi:uncharacterized protein involved in exopolysaccharide biosynthesis
MRPLQSPDLAEAFGADVRRANRRRLRVFLVVFILTAAIGLAWVFSRPPEYRATARLQITPSVLALPAGPAEGRQADARQAFLTEVQTLGSRPLIEQVAERLRSGGHDLASLGLDPVLALQSALTITAVEGTQVAELVAVGRQPELPAALLAGIVEAYGAYLAQNYRETTGEASARADEEAARLQAAVAAKRRAVDAFRSRHGIVSPEREENSILAEMQGLAAAQKDANKRLTEAEGRLEALRAAAAANKGVVRAKDNPTLAVLEARASQIREELREMSRRFTPDYMEMDPHARALRTRLAELEEQIRAQRTVGQSNALEEAEQELAAARESARRLQQQIAGAKQQVGAFASRFAQYKSLQDELGQLEKTYQEALQRQARLGATERARMPALQILEQAVIPKQAWRPLYWRDAGLVVAGALLLALGAMWLVELFNRPEPRPSVLVAQPVFSGPLLAGEPMQALPGALAPRRLAVEEPPRLAAPLALPRELTVDEAAALLQGADAETRRAVALLLSGLSPDEALALRWGDLDEATNVIRVGGPSSRQVPLAREVSVLLGPRGGQSAPVLARNEAAMPGAPTLEAQLLVAAHDAGIERAQEVTPAALRHTYIAFLVRQGARFADVTRWVGALDAEQLAAYSPLAPAGARLDAGAVVRLFPAVARAVGD